MLWVLQIMHAFSVAPFDQNLSIEGKGLTDDSASLGSLGVIPESIVCLKVAPRGGACRINSLALIRTAHQAFILTVFCFYYC
jgi:hypothetical protein